ncbi:hypothetical protein J4450_03840 [Candidatus Micrarchaeota archaeon]|nr:hypothetical protein [Candidatus Micrarchaeota archaeon]
MNYQKMLKAYYANCELNLPIEEINHRYFRFDVLGRFVKIKKSIKDNEELARILYRYAPTNAYYSVSKWLSPGEVEPTYKAKSIIQSMFLGSDIAFDIDFKPFSIENIERARIETVKLIDFLEQKEIKIKYIAFSGGKGFHVLCKDPNRYLHEHPLERERAAKRYRMLLVDDVAKENIEIDTSVTIDTRRIIRIPGTINAKTGYICRVLEENEILNSASEIIKNTPRVKQSTLATVWDEVQLRCIRIISKRAVRSRVSPAPFYLTTFLSNTVIGPKDRCVPFFVYNRRLEKVERELLELQSTYTLGNIYVLSSENSTFAFSIDSLPLRRMEKILKASSSSGINKLLKYKQLFMRIEQEEDKDGKILKEKPKLVKILFAESKHIQSAGHAQFLKDYYGISVEGNLHGNSEYKIIPSVIKI